MIFSVVWFYMSCPGMVWHVKGRYVWYGMIWYCIVRFVMLGEDMVSARPHPMPPGSAPWVVTSVAAETETGKEMMMMPGKWQWKMKAAVIDLSLKEKSWWYLNEGSSDQKYFWAEKNWETGKGTDLRNCESMTRVSAIDGGACRIWSHC